MDCSTDSHVSDKASGRSLGEACKMWNRQLHYYSGLYLLLFLWLFAFTGLLLNHPLWAFAEFWDSRRQANVERSINPPIPGGDLAQARDILRQLGLRGEIEWTTTRSDTNRFDFRASRPGHIFEIKTDLKQNRATIQSIDLNLWGVARILHSFSGVRWGEGRNDRDWIWTQVWVLTMDAVAAGLILMILSSYYMWYALQRKRWLGVLALSAGFLSCGLFCVGLRWIY